MTNYNEGTSMQLIQTKLSEIREDYPTGDKGTVIFVREIMEVLADYLSDDISSNLMC